MPSVEAEARCLALDGILCRCGSVARPVRLCAPRCGVFLHGRAAAQKKTDRNLQPVSGLSRSHMVEPQHMPSVGLSGSVGFLWNLIKLNVICWLCS